MRAFLILLAALALWAGPLNDLIGKPLPHLSLSGKEGHTVGGTPFDSKSLKGKVTVLFYVDPDKKDLNEAFTETLKARHFDRKNYRSVAVINMAATWMPNFVLNAALKSKQKAYPDTLYVKDFHKNGVKVWHLADNDANFLILSKNGEVLYAYSGKIPKSEWPTIFSVIQKAMNERSSQQ